jgi:hypothetical protein
MTIDQFRDIRSRAGALVILLPENVSQLSLEEKQVIIIIDFTDTFKLKKKY